ncbi:succinylglutamate desuccinylase/aspartoacylase family protein [Saccharibacillus sp. CPCC 101409]|uniref:succinylglutamate desuccinylase/aspartoacylase domain-containing protein n=1 Tax=Saccharibacillus sp. CPCC 101409 TaxID=3058041 RepID=UPI00267279EB|nr:succinylglutamate desuccinylase/aspartoacylase family protein [Saccharibacillus sp. CPCC 101409]MDO3412423.1 succinylglutamate desuccinylase/aspartoacylase family protein [Saccharibacillus sp. CPCC 101409]
MTGREDSSLFRSAFASDLRFNTLEEAFARQSAGSIARIDESFEQQTTTFWVVKGFGEGRTVWIQAALHGDEHDGVIACGRLLAELAPGELRGTLVVCPVANPSALLAYANASPIDGVNLNRVFGGSGGSNPKSGSYSYRYGRWLADKIKSSADFLIDLHGGGQWLEVCPFAMAAGDRPEAYEEAMQALENLPLTAVYTCRADDKGMLINEAAAAGIPAVLLESGGGVSWTEEGVDTHLGSLHALLEHLGLGKLSSGVSARFDASSLRINDAALRITEVSELRFETDGIRTFNRRAGEQVRQGEPLLKVRVYPGLDEQTLVCPIEHGVILSIHAASAVRKGGYAVMLGKLA